MLMKQLLLISGIILISIFSYAQNGTLAFRVAGGTLLDQPKPGIAFALDLKIPKVPIAITPYFQNYNSGGLKKQYFGVNIQFTKNLTKGLYGGIGGGITKWSYNKQTRTSPSIGPLLGVRIRLIEKLSFFSEVKFNVNIKSNQDTNDFNSGIQINGPLFDNDISGIIGLSYILL